MNSRGSVSINHLACFPYVLLFLSTCFVFLLSTFVNVLTCKKGTHTRAYVSEATLRLGVYD